MKPFLYNLAALVAGILIVWLFTEISNRTTTSRAGKVVGCCVAGALCWAAGRTFLALALEALSHAK